jgi:very-short-patch-repair endonuclease
MGRSVRARGLIADPNHRPTRSELEDLFRRFCARHRLPMPQINATIADLDGREVDAFYPAEKLIVELDGWWFHCDRLSFERDRKKDATALARGYATIRITEERLTHGGRDEADTIRSILADRGAAAR